MNIGGLNTVLTVLKSNEISEDEINKLIKDLDELALNEFLTKEYCSQIGNFIKEKIQEDVERYSKLFESIHNYTDTEIIEWILSCVISGITDQIILDNLAYCINLLLTKGSGFITDKIRFKYLEIYKNELVNINLGEEFYFIIKIMYYLTEEL